MAVQLYSDYEVLITLGLVAGMLFSLVHAGIHQCYWEAYLTWQRARMGTASWGGVG